MLFFIFQVMSSLIPIGTPPKDDPLDDEISHEVSRLQLNRPPAPEQMDTSEGPPRPVMKDVGPDPGKVSSAPDALSSTSSSSSSTLNQSSGSSSSNTTAAASAITPSTTTEKSLPKIPSLMKINCKRPKSVQFPKMYPLLRIPKSLIFQFKTRCGKRLPICFSCYRPGHLHHVCPNFIHGICSFCFNSHRVDIPCPAFRRLSR